jgi:uncharacterized OB-fold protein
MAVVLFVMTITPYLVLGIALVALASVFIGSWALENESDECAGCGTYLLPEAALCRTCGRGHG